MAAGRTHVAAAAALLVLAAARQPRRMYSDESPHRGSTLTAGAPGVVITESSGNVTDSTAVWQSFALAAPHWASQANTAFSLSEMGSFATYAWSCGCYATQGAYIMEKILALGSAADRTVARQWLVTAPQNADGKVWEAQNTEYHVGHQGAFEGAAEFVIMAAMYAAHTGDVAVFASAPERLVCYTVDGGATFHLAGAPQPGLNDSACQQAPRELLAASAGSAPPLLIEATNVPMVEYGDGGLVYNAGRMLVETVTINMPFTALAVPLTTQARANSLWWANVTAYSVATGDAVAFAAVNSTAIAQEWTVLQSLTGQAVPAGAYLLVLLAADATPGMTAGDSYWLAATWITNPYPTGSGGANQLTYGDAVAHHRAAPEAFGLPLVPRAHGSAQHAIAAHLARLRRKEQRDAGSAAPSGSLPPAPANLPMGGRSLAASVTAATAYNLALMSQVTASGFDVAVIPDPRFRGSLNASVNTGDSYYDLLRIGFASSYINLRILEALDAYADLQLAGFVPSCEYANDTCIPPDTITTARAALRTAIGNRFSDASTGRFIDWFGCESLAVPGATVRDCGLEFVSNGACTNATACGGLNTVWTDFVPTIALAAKLAVPAGGSNLAATTARFAALRDSTRVGTGGFWHTAALGLETVSPLTWQPSAGWALTTADGFAVKSENETGDWHMYSPAGGNGYGEWPLQCEQGGRLFTTTAMVWEASAGPYAELYTDWKRLVDGLTGISNQLAAGDYAVPLSSADPTFIAVPMTDPIVRDLCVKVRVQAGFPNVTDAWGQTYCDYYQEIGWSTPENGVPLYSVVKSLLGLRVWAGGDATVFGAQLPICTGDSALASLPAPWPAPIASVELRGLAVGSQYNVTVFCTSSNLLLTCVASC